MPEEEAPKQVEVANVSMVPAPDLSCAVVSFELFGVFNINIRIPSKAVHGFIKQWAMMQRDLLDQQRVLEQVKRSKIHA